MYRKKLFLSSSKVVESYRKFYKFDNFVYMQNFAIFPEALTFFPFGESDVYVVDVYVSNRYEINPNADYAVLLPMLSSDGIVFLGGCIDGIISKISLDHHGYYEIFYQNLYLTQSEIDQSPFQLSPSQPEYADGRSLGPKLCEIVMIPKEERVDSKILKMPQSAVGLLPSELIEYNSFPPVSN